MNKINQIGRQNEPKTTKVNKNLENAKNERKQIKPFGTL